MEFLCKVLQSLDISDIIQIASITASLLTSIVAIIISVKTLKQNSQVLEESTRPYIAIYLDSITICEQNSFFVLKNFGNTTATITKFEYSECLKHTAQKSKLMLDQFDYIQGITLSPGQSKMLIYEVSLLNTDAVSFKYEYVTSVNGKHYIEDISINVKNYYHIPVLRPESDIPEGNKRQVHTLREMIDRSI